METIQTWAIVLRILITLSEAKLSFLHNRKLFESKDSLVNNLVSLVRKGTGRRDLPWNALLVLATLACSSCEKEDVKPVAGGSMSSAGSMFCVLVKDEFTQDPVVHASVYVVFYDPTPAYSFQTGTHVNGSYFSSQGATDSTGKFFPKGPASLLYSIDVQQQGYIYQCGGHMPPVANGGFAYIHLRPVSMLRLHIKNVAPSSAGDEIFIQYPNPFCSGMSYLTGLAGSQVDTVVLLQSNDLCHLLSWRAWHNNVAIDSTMTGIIMHPRDTTSVEIMY